MNIEHGERPGRRTGDVPAIEIVDSVVAGTPDFAHIGAILHRTAKVSAGSGKSAIGAVAVHDQQAWMAAETEYLAGIGLYLNEFRRHYFVATQIRSEEHTSELQS